MVKTKELKFEMLKNAFRELDTDNLGMLRISEIKTTSLKIMIPQTKLKQI
jgi:hypothetical protein